MLELIALFVFISLSFVVIAVSGWATSRRPVSTTTRLQQVTAPSSAGGAIGGVGEGEDAGAWGLASDLVEKLGFWAQGTFQKDQSSEKKQDLTTTLAHAGFRDQRAPSIYMGLRVVLAVFFIAVLFSIAKIMEKEGLALVSAVAFGLVIGGFGPMWYLRWRTKKRCVSITKALPDCLDMLVICVESGLGLNAALDRVATERVKIKGDCLGAEVKYMTYELAAGVPRDQCFHNLGERNGVDDLQSLAAFMVQSEKLGAGLVDALKIYAEELRTRRRQKAQEQANKAAVKLLFPLVFFIFPTMFIVILGPAIMNLQASMATIWD